MGQVKTRPQEIFYKPFLQTNKIFFLLKIANFIPYSTAKYTPFWLENKKKARHELDLSQILLTGDPTGDECQNPKPYPRPKKLTPPIPKP